MKLFHFTAPYRDGHLGAILREGQITTTESNVSQTRAHAGPDSAEPPAARTLRTVSGARNPSTHEAKRAQILQDNG
jgi:hypothetical protein